MTERMNTMSPQTSVAISQIRFLALICILLHHSFCVYEGWPPNINVNIGLPASFQTISYVCKGIGMVAFCFISGMLVYYSFIKVAATSKIRYTGWKNFIIKKFRRLIVPALIWGAFYAVFFGDYMLTEYSPSFINGTHLWFLPMLFLLMLAVSPMLFCKHLWIVPILMLGLFFLHPFSRTTNEFVLYFPAFICGFFFYANECRKTEGVIKKVASTAAVILSGVIFYLILGRFGDLFIKYGIYLFVVATLLLIFKHVSSGLYHFFDLRPVRYATDNAFAIYIVHQFVIILIALSDISFLSTATVSNVLTYFIVTLCGSLAIVYVVSFLSRRYKVVEYLF